MADRSEFSAEAHFGQWVISDLKRAGCSDQQLSAIVLATVSTTTVFLRNNRRKALATNPSARQLAKQQYDFENALLRSVALALPKAQKRGRRKDIGTIKKFTRILELKATDTKWAKITEILNAEFGAGGNVDAYRKIYRRYLPLTLKLFLRHFLPTIPAEQILPKLLKAAKGQPGRPKKSDKTSNRNLSLFAAVNLRLNK